MEIEMLDNCNISRAWQELVSKFESRTISSAEFCKLHNISRGSIYKWVSVNLSALIKDLKTLDRCYMVGLTADLA